MRRAVVAGCGVYGLWWAVYCNWTFGDALGPEVGAVYRPVAGLLVWALVGPAVCGAVAPGAGWFRGARSAVLATLLTLAPLVGGWVVGEMVWSAWPLLVGAGATLLTMVLVGPAPVFARVDGVGAWRSVGRAIRRVRWRDAGAHLGALVVLVIGGALGAAGGWGREAWGAGVAPWMWVELVVGCVLVVWLTRRALRRAGVEVAGRVKAARVDRARMRAAAPVGGVVFAIGAAAAVGGAVDGWVVSGAAVLMGLAALAGAGMGGANRRAGVAAGLAGGLALLVVCVGVAVGAGVVEHLAWMVSPELQNFLPWVSLSGVSIHADQLALMVPPVTAPAGVALPVPSFEWVVGHGAVWPERAVARAWAVGVGVVGAPWALMAAGLAAREGLGWRAAASRARGLLGPVATATGVRLLVVGAGVALLGLPRILADVFVAAQIGWAAAAGVYAAWVVGVGAALLDRVSPAASAASPASRETGGA